MDRENKTGHSFNKEFKSRMILESINRKVRREEERIQDLETTMKFMEIPIQTYNTYKGKISKMTHYLDTFEDDSF